MNQNPFEALAPSTLAAIVADIDAHLEMTPGNPLVESLRQAAYDTLAHNMGLEDADKAIAAHLQQNY